MNLHNATLGKIKRIFITLCFFFPLLIASSCDVLNGVLKDYTATGGLTNTEIVSGLKEALKVGANLAASSASQQNGYLNNPVANIRIPMPPELQKIEKNIRKIPLVGNNVADNFIEAMNRGAEKAAKEAAPILVNAITSMNISDAVGILKGDSTAATSYLERTTSSQLAAKFQPIIKKALNDVGAVKYYDALKQAIATYNKSPLSSNINVNLKNLPVLDEYATEQALSGLFKLVAKEEKDIRKDPLGQSKDIIRKVFGSVRPQPSIGK